VSHTAGPWRIAGDAPEGIVIMTERHNDSTIVAIAPGPYRKHIDAETRATANLIAAAPELLEALEELLEADLWADAEGLWRIQDSDTTRGEPAVKKARAVVVEARGITPISREGR
jgi:hypothetical protein